MKEATGELNMTVVTVVAIAAIAAFFYAFVWPVIQGNIQNSSRCASAICTCPADQAVCNQCTYIDENNESQTITCTQRAQNNN